MKLCVALDLSNKAEILTLVRSLKYFDNLWFKVGFRTYIRDGREIIDTIKSINPSFKIFVDLKLYDIPNTMADAAEEIADLGVDMFNVHASAGKRAMQDVMTRLEKYEMRPIVLAVTALTSFTEDEFIDVYDRSIEDKADQFAKDADDSGLDGVVCSAFESESIKLATSEKFMTLCPGIRPFGEDAGDQARVANIAYAKNVLVDIIVVGRPIYKAENPVEVVEKILAEI